MAQEEGSIFEDGDALELLCRDVCCAIKSEMGDSSKLIASLALGESSRELARKLENKRKDSKILCLMERTQRKVFREKATAVINRAIHEAIREASLLSEIENECRRKSNEESCGSRTYHRRLLNKDVATLRDKVVSTINSLFHLLSNLYDVYASSSKGNVKLRHHDALRACEYMEISDSTIRASSIRYDKLLEDLKMRNFQG